MRAPRIDIHSHFVPDFYRQALLDAGHSRPDGIKAIPEWSARSALALMDELNIRTSVLSISSPGVHFGDPRAAAELARHVNDEGAGRRWLIRRGSARAATGVTRTPSAWA